MSYFFMFFSGAVKGPFPEAFQDIFFGLRVNVGSQVGPFLGPVLVSFLRSFFSVISKGSRVIRQDQLPAPRSSQGGVGGHLAKAK